MAMDLTDFDAALFLREYWQKQPLLIRNPWLHWANPLEPGELAALACENEVESRLVVQGADDWRVEHGPLAESRFATLGKEPWTLLVQAVDHHVPDVAALLEPFRFIPNWRIDDVMVSYAVEGGGVGAHFDSYDVFLIQGLGRRRWQIGDRCDDTTELLPRDDLRLLAAFEPVEEWVLEAGDILYVPPGVAHNGIAASADCMTYSVGFRAPSCSELIASWTDDLVAGMAEDGRYGDPDLTVQDNPGEIAAPAIDRLHAMVTEKLRDRAAFARWFAGYSTEPKYPEIDWRPDDPLDADEVRALASDTALLRNPASRFAFVRESAGSLALFVNGKCFKCADEAAEFAELVCAQERVMLSEEIISSQPAIALVTDLLNRGSIAFELDD